MGRPKRSEIGDSNRRSQVLLAAARLFQQKGYHATSVRDVARATRMQSGSPFYHFPTKSDLLFAAVEHGLQVCLAELRAVDRSTLPPLDYARTLARIQVGRILGDDTSTAPLVVDEWKFLDGEPLQRVLALRAEFEALWLDALAGLQRAGLVRRADRLACRFFLSMLNGTFRWYRRSGVLTPEQIADALVDYIVQPPADAAHDAAAAVARLRDENHRLRMMVTDLLLQRDVDRAG